MGLKETHFFSWTVKRYATAGSCKFSSLEKIIAAVAQGSILGLLLFNNFINYLFLFCSSSNLSSYSDDNTLYASGFNLEEAKNCLSTDFNVVMK